MKKNWFRSGLTAVLCAVMLATGVSAASIGGGTTTTDVNLRNGASISNGIIVTLPANTKVVVQEKAGDWYKVVYNGTEGYISGDYLTVSQDASGNFGTGTITATSVCFRSGASTGDSVIGSFDPGATMKVTGVKGNWYQVDYNGTTGYVSADYLKLSGASGASSSAAPASSGTSASGSVKGDYVRLRSGAGTGYSILGTYNNGTALTITGTEGDWSKVTIGGVSGYMSSEYVTTGSAQSAPAQTASQTGYINGTEVRMRSGAGTTTSILGVYNTGTEMTITGESNGWYAVTYNGTNGYVCKDYMTTSKPAAAASAASASSGTDGYIKGDYVRLRSGAGTTYSVLGMYNNGTPLTITGTSGDWSSVTINGKQGYVCSLYVTTTKAASPAPAAAPAETSSTTTTESTGSSIQQTIVATAKKYLGYPYVYGGMSPSGFDCSGFVNYVYKQCGYSMNRVASAIYYNNGTYVEKANLQPGDLVFFSNSSEHVGHVGIYIGNNQFIHASTSTVGVIISDLGSSYYIQHYVGAKRIIQ